MNSKRKGSAGERELVDILTAEGFPARRNEQRFVGGAGNPDVAADGLEAYHIEVKRVERLNIGEAMKQAESDAAGLLPVVMHRRSREPWLVTLHLADWLKEKITPAAAEDMRKAKAQELTPDTFRAMFNRTVEKAKATPGWNSLPLQNQIMIMCRSAYLGGYSAALKERM